MTCMTDRDTATMIDDLEVHIEALAGSTFDGDARRATDAALALVYRIQDALKTRRGAAYWTEIDDTIDGRLTGAVNLARNVNTHTLVVESGHSEVYPSENLFPGADLTIGATYRWSDYDAVVDVLSPPSSGRRDRRSDYRGMLSQRAVIPTLRTVANFYRGQHVAALTRDGTWWRDESRAEC